MTEQEQLMFGMSKEHIKKQYINTYVTASCGVEMTVMSILSDAQYILECYGDVEEAKDRSRKLMNVAKFILSEQLSKKMEKAA